jgi:hypothetical protein
MAEPQSYAGDKVSSELGGPEKARSRLPVSAVMAARIPETCALYLKCGIAGMYWT